MGKKKLDLVQIIRDNPGAVATIDNDYWRLDKKSRHDMPEDADEEDWDTENELCNSRDDFKKLGDGGYGSGCRYGGDILQALAAIVGVTIESV